MLTAFRMYENQSGGPGAKPALDTLIQHVLAFAEVHKGWRRAKEKEGPSDGRTVPTPGL